MMIWRLDPFLLTFLDSAEHALASALEARQRRRESGGEDHSLTTLTQSERIATLQRTIDALHVALERGESSIVH